MKLKTSFFNGAVYRKDLTRFSPVWISYSLILLLFLSNFVGQRTEYIRTLNFSDTITWMVVLNFGYAFALVQLLFGDMFNPRLCNALHGLPLRRECWFLTHLSACLTFALVPNIVAALCALPFLGSARIVALWWLGAVTLQLLFFLGTAVFSAMLVGNRFAMVPVYVLANFLSLLVYFFAVQLYEPLLYGVRLEVTMEDICILLCPVFYMVSECDIMHIQPERSSESAAILTDGPTQTFATGIGGDDFSYTCQLGDGWGYCVICAVIGVVLILAALLLYRRRKLEVAGDFLAFEGIKPVFLVLFTLGMGGVFQLFSVMFDIGAQIFFLAIGLVVGYYCCRMLLMRTTRVFQPRAVVGLAGIVLVIAASLVLTKLDVFGIVRYVPQPEEVASIAFTERWSLDLDDGYRQFTVTDPADIRELTQIHQELVEGRDNSVKSDVRFLVRYTLKSGKTVERYYDSGPADGEASQRLKLYYSSFTYLTGVPEEQISELAENVDYFYFYGFEGDIFERSGARCAELDIEGLLRAIAADCAAGTMAQGGERYHTGQVLLCQLDMTSRLNGKELGLYLQIYSDCEHTTAWLEDNGFRLLWDREVIK